MQIAWPLVFIHPSRSGPSTKARTGEPEGRLCRKKLQRKPLPVETNAHGAVNGLPLSPLLPAGESGVCPPQPHARRGDPRARLGREGEVPAPSQAGEPRTGPQGRTRACSAQGPRGSSVGRG